MSKAYRGRMLLIIVYLFQAPAVWAQNQAEGKKLYTTYCSSCHGESGKGDGAAGASLPVKPADHTNGAAMNQLSDSFLVEIISKGGGAAGKSTFMPAWGGALNDKQIRDIVAYIRSIAVPPYNPDLPSKKNR
jgi:mono/diheme cytochrome c family protein